MNVRKVLQVEGSNTHEESCGMFQEVLTWGKIQVEQERGCRSPGRGYVDRRSKVKE